MKDRIGKDFGFPKVMMQYNQRGILVNLYLKNTRDGALIPFFNPTTNVFDNDIKEKIINDFLKPYIDQLMNSSNESERGMRLHAVNIGVFLSQNENNVAICFYDFPKKSCTLNILEEAMFHIQSIHKENSNRFMIPINTPGHVSLALFDSTSIISKNDINVINPKGIVLFDPNGPNDEQKIRDNLFRIIFHGIPEKERPCILCKLPINIQADSSCGVCVIEAAHYFANDEQNAGVLQFQTKFNEVLDVKPLILNIAKFAKISKSNSEQVLRTDIHIPSYIIDKESLTCINLLDRENSQENIKKVNETLSCQRNRLSENLLKLAVPYLLIDIGNKEQEIKRDGQETPKQDIIKQL